MQAPFNVAKFKEMQEDLVKAFSEVPNALLPDPGIASGLASWFTKNVSVSLVNSFGSPLLKTSNPWEVLINSMELEKQIYQFISQEFRRLDRNSPLKNELDKLNNVIQCLKVLQSVNKILTNAAPEILLTCNNSNLKNHLNIIYQRINILPYIRAEKVLDNPTTHTVTNKNAEDFLLKMKNALLLCLLKGGLGKNGHGFIVSLANVLQQKNHSIDLKVIELHSPSSLEMSAAGEGAYALLTEEELQANSPQDIIKRLEFPIKNNTGSSSLLPCPVWFSSAEEYAAKGDRNMYFQDSKMIDIACHRLLRGAIAFDNSGAPYYTPYHIISLHELVHGMHNSQGINVINMGVIPALGEIDTPEMSLWRKIWTDAEEYYSIVASLECTENKLNRDIDLPDRYGHLAIIEHILLDSRDPRYEEELALSINQLSGFAYIQELTNINSTSTMLRALRIPGDQGTVAQPVIAPPGGTPILQQKLSTEEKQQAEQEMRQEESKAEKTESGKEKKQEEKKTEKKGPDKKPEEGDDNKPSM